MTVSVTHSTPADDSFSAEGAAAWDAGHVVIGAAASGANSDITNLTGLTGGITTPDYITFNTTPETVPTAPGSLYWDSADGNQTLSLVMADNAAVQQIGQEQYYRIKASSAITNGQVVMFTGSVGASGALTGAPATGLTASTASYIMGIATQDIAENQWGYVTSFGLVRGINTTGGAESWVNGQILYYNPSVAGGLTKTVPAAPNAKIQVCAVVYASSGGAGSVFVRPTFGGALGQFEGNVEITSPVTNDFLIYSGIENRWKNVAGSSVTVGTATNATNVAVTDNTTSVATWYPAIFQSTSGNLGARTSSTKLKFIPSSGTLQTVGPFYCKSFFQMDGTATTSPSSIFSIQDQAGNCVAEIGRQDGVASVCAFDFHTGATAVDYDVRWQLSGGNGTVGQGDLNILAGTLRLNSVSVVTTTGTQTLSNKTLSSPIITGSVLTFNGTTFNVTTGIGGGTF